MDIKIWNSEETWTEDRNLRIIGIKTVTGDATGKVVSQRKKAHGTLTLNRWGEKNISKI